LLWSVSQQSTWLPSSEKQAPLTRPTSTPPLTKIEIFSYPVFFKELINSSKPCCKETFGCHFRSFFALASVCLRFLGRRLEVFSEKKQFAF